MRSAWFLVSALSALAAADEAGTTTIKYFGVDLPNDGIDLGAYTSTAARVVAIGKDATTYEIACLKDASQCALNHPATIVNGPATFSISIAATVSTGGAQAVATAVEHCSFTHLSESAVCSYSFEFTASAGDLTTSNSASSTESIPASAVSYHSLTITDGAYALTGAATGSASAVTVTPTASTGGAAGAMKPLITAAPLGAAAFAAFAAMI